ncbi:hypothetical protein HDE_05161 [Halotydeus destructor]|nr:hypothetical protein HDE_05161 [Halotydeus destructor]
MISFGRIILDVLTKKPVIRTLFNLAHMSMVILLLHCGMYFYPGGVFCYLPLTDTISSAIVYGYMMLKSVKTTGENLPSKQVVLWSQVVHYVLLLAHAVRFLTEPECAPVMVTAFQAIYATVSLIFVFAMHQADLFSKVEKVKST